MFPFSTQHIVYDIETCGLDGKSRVFMGRRVLRPRICWRPLKVSLWKIVDYHELTEEETNKLIDTKIRKLYENFLGLINN